MFWNKLGIYEILKILEYLYLEIRIDDSNTRYRLSTGYEVQIWGEHKVFKQKFDNVSLKDIVGKWGNIFKRVFFLWKTCEIFITRIIRDENVIECKYKHDVEIIEALKKRTNHFLYKIRYEVDLEAEIQISDKRLRILHNNNGKKYVILENIN